MKRIFVQLCLIFTLHQITSVPCESDLILNNIEIGVSFDLDKHTCFISPGHMRMYQLNVPEEIEIDNLPFKTVLYSLLTDCFQRYDARPGMEYQIGSQRKAHECLRTFNRRIKLTYPELTFPDLVQILPLEEDFPRIDTNTYWSN